MPPPPTAAPSDSSRWEDALVESDGSLSALLTAAQPGKLR